MLILFLIYISNYQYK